MKRAAFIIALFACTAGSAADPYAGYIYPSGIQAGTTNRFIIGGQNLWRLRGMHFSCGGLKAIEIKPVPNLQPPLGTQKRHLINWLDGIAGGVREEPPKPDGSHVGEWRSNVWYQALGSLDALEISIVERYLFTPRNPLQAAPSLRQMCIVEIAADAGLKPGTYDFSLWNDAGISAPRPFLVTACPRAAEPLFRPSHRPETETDVIKVESAGVVLDGQIMPGEIDRFRLYLAEGRRYVFKVVARELQPYVGDAVPGFFNAAATVRNAEGRVVAFGDDTARFRPDPQFDFTPSASGVYTVEIHDVLYRGRADFVYSLEVGPCAAASSATVRKPADESDAGEGVSRFAGVVQDTGGKAVSEFTVDRPGKRILEVFARRDGSSLDAVLTLRKAGDQRPLAVWDDTTNRFFIGTVAQAECDSVGEYDFTEPGRYIVEIRDRTGHGGEDYFWRLEVRRPNPGFEVYSTRSTLPLYNGKPLTVDFVIVRKDGFDGKVTLEFPQDVTAAERTAASGVERMTAMLIYTGRKPLDFNAVRIFARGTIRGKTLRKEVVACDEYEQAFAWRHLVPAKSFLLRAKPGRTARKKENETKAGKLKKATTPGKRF